MSGIQQMLLGAAGGLVKPFTAWNVSADNAPGALATATFSLLSNGGVTGSGSPIDNTTPGSNSWYRPNTTGIGSLYWVRFTPTSGTLTTNDAPTFTQLNATRSVTKGASASAASCTFTIEIALDAAGTNIVFTASSTVGYTHT